MSLTIAILSYSREFYTTQRLLEAGENLGHRVSILNPFGLTIKASETGVCLFNHKQMIEWPDVIIPRVGAVFTDWNLLIVETLIGGGATSPASPQALTLAADKARSAIILGQKGVPAVMTYILREEAQIDPVLDAIESDRFVLKLTHGTQGRTVQAARDRAEAKKKIQAWLDKDHPVLVQPWIALKQVRDLRVMIVSGRAVAGAWRYAKEGDFRSNIHQGGHAEQATLSLEAINIAEAAAQALDLACGAVDLIETPTGFQVLEINGCPGFKSIESTSGLDVAALWIKAAVDG